MDTRLLDALDSVVRRQSSASEVSLALGHARSWWGQRMQAGAIRESEARAVAAFLGLDYSLLVLTTYGPAGLHQPTGPNPPIVERAFRAAITSPSESRLCNRRFLEEIDELRFTDPATTLERASDNIELVTVDHLPTLLGIAGSAAQRLLHTQAYHILYAAVSLAEKYGQPKGALFQRISTFYGVRGDYATALQCTHYALESYALHADQHGQAKVFAERCSWCFHSKDYAKAQAWAGSALRRLPPCDYRSRLLVLQVLALVAIECDDEAQADFFFRVVEQDADRLGGIHGAKIHWLKGRLANKFERYDEGLPFLALAVDELLKSRIPAHLGDAALAACDLVQAQICTGATNAAVATIEELIPLLESLRRYPEVVKALGALISARHAGLTLQKVGQARAVFDRARPSLLEFSRKD